MAVLPERFAGAGFEFRDTFWERTFMRYLPYAAASSEPNVIVDGTANDRTLITLSHWRRSGTPADLMADTSTAIVFNYLDRPDLHVAADVVSNNHFDEDGLVGIYALLEPEAAASRRDLLIDAAQAGDFGVFRSRRAARIAFAISAHADPSRSPFPRPLFDRPAPQVEEGLYRALLDVLPRLLVDIDGYRSLWRPEDAALTNTEQLFDAGRITIEEQPELDLAVVRGPSAGEWHPMAVHTRTAATRLLLVHGARVEFRYRYESWVQMASRRPALRVDLSALAGELTREDRSDGRWRFEGVEHITPRMYREGGASVLTAEDIRRRLEAALRAGAPAWNPYG
ncbi:MAG: hypothetical protein OXG72_11720 [Acidobacteria bacterium]|nr:hypothetical protein [Acidobacteriota bacterium]